MYLWIARGSHELGESATAGTANHRGFGHLRRPPSKRYQASYIGPAHRTADLRGDGAGWLIDEKRRIATEAWVAPRLRAVLGESAPTTMGEQATSWITRRVLKPSTRADHQSLRP